MGRSDLAYDLLLQESYPSWLYCVNQGATTMWERWNSYTAQDGFFPSSTNSFNHYAYGAVGEWIYRYMAGIEADENAPGFKHFILQPQLDDRAVVPDGEEHVQYVSASYESPYGMITSSWQVNDAEGTVSYTCSVPANTTATLYLPQLPEGGISENGRSIAVAEGVSYRGVVDGCYVMELLAGEYSFCLRGVVRGDN